MKLKCGTKLDASSVSFPPCSKYLHVQYVTSLSTKYIIITNLPVKMNSSSNSKEAKITQKNAIRSNRKIFDP